MTAAYAVPEGDNGRRPWLPDADYRSVFRQLTRAAILGAPPGRVLAANPAACQLLGASEDELRALGCAPIQDPDDARWEVAVAERRLSGHVEANLRMRRRDGAIIDVKLESSIWLNEDGQERSLVLLIERTKGVHALARPTNDLSGHAHLTRAELRMLGFLPTHYSIGTISNMLFIAQNTGKSHIASIYRKLGVHSRSSAVARARALGILRFPVE